MNKKQNGIGIGVLLGAVVGVITGILFAPKSGKETRDAIKSTTTDTAHKLHDEAEKLQSDAKEWIAKADAKAKASKGKTEESAKQHATELKKQAKNVAQVVSSVKAGKADDKDLQSAIKQLKGARTSLKSFLAK